MEEVLGEFDRRYFEIYGHRNIHLSKADSCGEFRFLSHYLRAMHLPDPALFDLDGSIGTVSTLISPVQEGENSEALASTLSETLISRRATAFEASNLLCSLLLGAGFDAYVVRGTVDTSRFPKTQTAVCRPSSSIGKVSGPLKTSEIPFVLPKASVLSSKYLEMASSLLNPEMASAQQPTKTFIPAGAEVEHVPEVKESYWVWVCKGKRSLGTSIHVEPFSGSKYADEGKSPFLTVDCVYNDHNLYLHVYRNRFSVEIDRSDLFERVLSEGTKSGLSGRDVFDISARLSVAHPPLDKALVRPLPSDASRRGDTTVSLTKTHAPYSQADGLVKWTMRGPGETPSEIVEEFKHRRDKLQRRVFCPEKNLTVEYFEPGRPDGLKELGLVPGVETHAFYHQSRLDGLVELVSHPGKLYLERFVNRYDQLTKFVVKFSRNHTGVDSSVSKIGRAYASRFDIPTTAADSVEQIFRKISFLQDRSTVALVRHERTGELIPRKLMYSRKDGAFTKLPESKTTIDLTERQIAELVQLEKASKVYYNEAQARLTAELEQRLKEEALVKSWLRHAPSSTRDYVSTIGETSRDATLELSMYDVAVSRARGDDKAKAKHSEQVDANKTEKADILAPYLLDFGGKQLDALQAEFVVKKVKNDFRKRLLDRAAVMQKRLEDEQEQLRKRRAQMQRRGDVADKSEGDFEKYQQLAMFRIQILEQSLARHEMQAIKKFTELEKQLSEDNRLAAMWVKH